MQFIILIWVWLAQYWWLVSVLFAGSAICRFAVDWLVVHNLQFLVWYAWLWWVLGILLVLALIMRFVFNGIGVQ